MNEQDRDKITKLEKKNERNFIISILILLLLLIIIFLLVRNLGFINHRPRIPTGNIDIFDIFFKKDCPTCDCNCGTTDCPSFGQNDKPATKPEVGGNDEPTYPDTPGTSEPENPPQEPGKEEENPPSTGGNENNPTKPDEPQEGLEVFDKDIEYGDNTKLNIFSKTSYYVVDGKIAPGSENAYQFVIRNNNDFNIKYNLELEETNKFKINMKYRLKLNNNYVVGDEDDWVSYEELNQYNLNLTSNTYDIYTLDWKWFESSNDTEIGMDIESNYQLDIKISAFSY